MPASPLCAGEHCVCVCTRQKMARSEEACTTRNALPSDLIDAEQIPRGWGGGGNRRLGGGTNMVVASLTKVYPQMMTIHCSGWYRGCGPRCQSAAAAAAAAAVKTLLAVSVIKTAQVNWVASVIVRRCRAACSRVSRLHATCNQERHCWLIGRMKDLKKKRAVYTRRFSSDQPFAAIICLHANLANDKIHKGDGVPPWLNEKRLKSSGRQKSESASFYVSKVSFILFYSFTDTPANLLIFMQRKVNHNDAESTFYVHDILWLRSSD